MTQEYNPLGTDGFEFVEYTAATEEGIGQLKDLFVSLGFVLLFFRSIKNGTFRSVVRPRF